MCTASIYQSSSQLQTSCTCNLTSRKCPKQHSTDCSTDLEGFSKPTLLAGYNNGLDSFAWDRQEVPNSFSPFDDLQAPTHRNIQASTQHDVHPSMLARQTLAARPYPKDPTRHDLGQTLSLPSSSGTPRSGGPKAGQGGGGWSRRKAKQKKGPSGDSSVMQRCLEVIEQLLEEEDAEPFAEPVCFDPYKSCCFCMLRFCILHSSSNHVAEQELLEKQSQHPFCQTHRCTMD